MTLAAHLAAGEAKWLRWLGAYDRRAGWETWSCRSAAEWLNNKCGMSLTAGRERVRVARSLQDLPLTQTAFVNGELSTDDGTSPSDEATCSDDALLLAKQFASSRSNGDGTSTLKVCLADDTMAMITAAINAKVDELISDMTQGKELTRRQAIDHHGGYPALRARALAGVIGDGGVETTVMLIIPLDTLGTDKQKPAPHTADGPDTDTDEPGQSQSTPDVPGPLPRPRADADVPQRPEPRPQADADVPQRPEPRPQAGADVPQRPEPRPQAGAEESQPPLLEPSGLQVDEATNGRGGVRSKVARLLCDCRVNMTLVDKNGGPLSIGRHSRVIPTKIRTALEIRDHGICRFPGCGSTRNLQAHHITHWQHGGPTELSNLVLRCWFHHDLLHGQAANDATSVADHQGCWTVEPVPTNESKAGGWFRFSTPNGDLATVKHSRGSVNALYWHAREPRPQPEDTRADSTRTHRWRPPSGPVLDNHLNHPQRNQPTTTTPPRPRQ